jgi:anti-sigma B factor antagonist
VGGSEGALSVIVEKPRPGFAIVRPTGRLNMVTAGELRQSIVDAVASGHASVAVDLSGVDFMDSSGLGAIVGAMKTAQKAKGDVRIAAPSDQVKLVLQLTNMDRVLKPYATAEGAFDD